MPEGLCSRILFQHCAQFIDQGLSPVFIKLYLSVYICNSHDFQRVDKRKTEVAFEFCKQKLPVLTKVTFVKSYFYQDRSYKQRADRTRLIFTVCRSHHVCCHRMLVPEA